MGQAPGWMLPNLPNPRYCTRIDKITEGCFSTSFQLSKSKVVMDTHRWMNWTKAEPMAIACTVYDGTLGLPCSEVACLTVLVIQCFTENKIKFYIHLSPKKYTRAYSQGKFYNYNNKYNVTHHYLKPEMKKKLPFGA